MACNSFENTLNWFMTHNLLQENGNFQESRLFEVRDSIKLLENTAKRKYNIHDNLITIVKLNKLKDVAHSTYRRDSNIVLYRLNFNKEAFKKIR